MKNKIEDLRNHLFATLEALQDKENPMDIKRAEAIANVARVVIDSAMAEVAHMKLTGGVGSGFIPEGQHRLPAPGGQITPPPTHVHRLR